MRYDDDAVTEMLEHANGHFLIHRMVLGQQDAKRRAGWHGFWHSRGGDLAATEHGGTGPQGHFLDEDVVEFGLTNRFREANRDFERPASRRVVRLTGRCEEQEPCTGDFGLLAYLCRQVEAVHLGHHAVDENDGIGFASVDRISQRREGRSASVNRVRAACPSL